ncbi:hypothetical protein, variant 3 [Aphanomyces astaci]|uniref:RING-type domain-containing protein n=1 Tax=Aphanomyces astaci TaxID=112090 RepID=W4H200_APHAT|nr:hypothetical protein, variant 1 [Aphanomyces astaci]XP_009825201.1 hypothetical protein, variant 3 [Aphanomyces astaci]ETV85181.1 hypothetical protein, variant 1 [Aphanomyces astaci]ETV85183.1 hypothetical protein, variant 3 [Aphanomyces astaci]|eukprot:XP_009825199.1 hypothetical protein, variant 1 [Aphanomyces astaci]
MGYSARAINGVLCACVIIGSPANLPAAADSLWTEVSARLVRQPMARERTVMEVIGDAAYIYGGVGDANDAAFNDTWKFDFIGQRWDQLTVVANPGPRFDHVSATYGSDIYIFGGTTYDSKLVSASNDGTAPMNDMWKLDSMQVEWSVIDGGGQGGVVRPVSRSQASAVSTPKAMIVFGGVFTPNVFYLPPVDFNDVWAFDFQSHTWQSVAIATKSVLPIARFSHVASTILVNGVVNMIVFSGRHIVNTRWSILSDAWVLPLSTSGEALPIWTQLTVSRPFGRILSGMVAIDSSHMWLFGGFAFDSQMQAVAFSDTLAADVSLVPIVSLKTVSTQTAHAEGSSVNVNNGPRARFGHRMSVWKGNVVVYGGRIVQCLGDVWLRNASLATQGATDATTEDPWRSFTSIMLLIILFLLSLFLCLYIAMWVVKCFRPAQSSVMGVTDARRVATRQVAPTGGISASDIAQFKVILFTPSAATAPTDEICPICLVEFEAQERLRQLPCQHHFHVACIDEWLQRNLTCPMCKRDLTLTASPPQASVTDPVQSNAVVPPYGPSNGTVSPELRRPVAV